MEWDKIEDLLNKYFEGETTLKEEAELFDYFNNKEVARHLQQYQPLFQGLKMAREEKYEGKPTLPPTRIPNNRTWMYPVAAMIVVALTVGGFVFNNQQMSQDEKEALMAFEQTKHALNLLSKNLNEGTHQLVYVNQFEDAKDKVWKASDED